MKTQRPQSYEPPLPIYSSGHVLSQRNSNVGKIMPTVIRNGSVNSSIGKINRNNGSSPSKSYSSAQSSGKQNHLKMIEITDPSSYDQENNPLNLNRIQHSSGQSSSPRKLQTQPLILDQSDSISSYHNKHHFNREDLQRVLAAENSVEDLLTFLTTKFNKLIESLRIEELEKKQLQRQCLDQQLKIRSYEDFEQVLSVQETLREHANYKQRLIHLEHELAVTTYEKNRLQGAFDEMKRKIEDRVPAISEVEERRRELEQQNADGELEIKNLQEQLRDSIKKHAKTTVMLQNSEKKVKELE